MKIVVTTFQRIYATAFDTVFDEIKRTIAQLHQTNVVAMEVRSSSLLTHYAFELDGGDVNAAAQTLVNAFHPAKGDFLLDESVITHGYFCEEQEQEEAPVSRLPIYAD